MRKSRGRGKNNFNDNYYNSDSPMMPTRYAHVSSRLIIRAIERIFYPIIGLIVALFIFAVLDITDVISKYNILPDRTYDIIITFAAAILLITVVYLLYGLIKTRKMLYDWADIFEKNSIKAGMSIAMSNTSKEEVLRALSETVQGIGEPLRQYLSSGPERYKNLIDIQIDEEIVFDVLIDKDHITNQIPPIPPNQVSSIALSSKTPASSIPNNEGTGKNTFDLFESTKEYGAILANVINGRISTEIVKSFQEKVVRYISLTRNKVGLAMIIGDSIEVGAEDLTRLRTKGIDYFVLIEK